MQTNFENWVGLQNVHQYVVSQSNALPILSTVPTDSNTHLPTELYSINGFNHIAPIVSYSHEYLQRVNLSLSQCFSYFFLLTYGLCVIFCEHLAVNAEATSSHQLSQYKHVMWNATG